MGNQASLQGRDRIGAVVYSELKRRFDADGSAVDVDEGPSSRRAALVSRWRSSLQTTSQVRERPAPVTSALLPEHGSELGAPGVQPSNGDGGSCCGRVPNSSIVALRGSASGATSPSRLDFRSIADGAEVPEQPGGHSFDGVRTVGAPDCRGSRGDCRRRTVSTEPSEAAASESESHCGGSIAGELHSTGRRRVERQSDTCAAEDDVSGAADDAFYNGDGMSGLNSPPISQAVDCCYSHPLSDLLPTAATPRSPDASLATGEDLFSWLQSELDSVYAEARDIELRLGQLSLKHPSSTGRDTGRPQRSVSVAETRSDSLDPCGSSDACRTAVAAVRRHTVVSTHLRLSAPEALTSWQVSDVSPLPTDGWISAAQAVDGHPAVDQLMIADHFDNVGDHSSKLELPTDGNGECYISEACPLMVHATNRIGNCGNTDTLKGYKYITEDLGLRSVYTVRSDLYCAVRACLAGALLQGISVYDHLQPAEKLLKALQECVESHKNLQCWEIADSEQVTDCVVARLEPYLIILYDLCYQALVSPAAVREYVVHRLVNDMARDRACMEALKVLMMLRAYELHQAVVSNSRGVCSDRLPAYAHKLFADDAYRNPDYLFGNHVNGVGIRHRLAEDVMPLLADVLGIGLLVFWPSRFGRADFSYQFNSSVEVSKRGCDRCVNLVADENGCYGIIVP